MLAWIPILVTFVKDSWIYVFIDRLGYVGATLGGIVVGWLVENYSWDAAFKFWIASAFIAAGLMAIPWRYRPPREKYF